MEDFEKYIIENSASFNEEPREGHFERFEQRLQKQKVNRRRSLIRNSMRVASVAVLLIMSALYVNDRFFNQIEEDIYINQEFLEAQFYYKTQINEGISTIKSIDGVLNDEQREQLVDEMSEADAFFEELQKDLETTPDDPRVIEAMLNHYKTKAMIINNIVNNLEKINQKKTDSSVPVAM